MKITVQMCDSFDPTKSKKFYQKLKLLSNKLKILT